MNNKSNKCITPQSVLNDNELYGFLWRNPYGYESQDTIEAKLKTLRNGSTTTVSNGYKQQKPNTKISEALTTEFVAQTTKKSESITM